MDTALGNPRLPGLCPPALKVVEAGGGLIASSMYANNPAGESQSAYEQVCGRSMICRSGVDGGDTGVRKCVCIDPSGIDVGIEPDIVEATENMSSCV